MHIDHLVYGVPDLEEGVADLAARLGVRAVAGGRHEGRGTHNALLGLGDGTYLEIIAPDPTQGGPSGPRPFGLDASRRARLVAWALTAPDIDELVGRARAAGYDPGPVEDMSRLRQDKSRLRWRLTRGGAGGELVVPFLIDWGTSEHPSVTAPAGVVLKELSIEHPAAGAIRRALSALEASVAVREGPAAALVARLRTPQGTVELR
ncbi:MAG: VOC family protein [Candidatus Dormiibacterota bacterium]